MKYLLGEKLNFDWKVTTVTIVSTLLLIVDHYYTFTAHKYWDRLILYLVIPLLIIVILFRENPKEYGFSFGDWKLGLTYTVLGILHHGSHHLLSGKRQCSHENVLRETFTWSPVDNLY